MRPELHPACAAWPSLSDTDFAEFVEDIRRNGLIEPITLTSDGLLLSGKVRWDACELVGIEPRTEVYKGDNPTGFVASKNQHRRHMSTSQKAMAVAKMARLQHGANQYQIKVDCVSDTILSVQDLSKQSGVSVAVINYGRTVLHNGLPHIAGMVESGDINVRVAAEAVRRTPKDAQVEWTQEDVEREGRRVIRAFPSNQRIEVTRRKRAKAEAAGDRPTVIHVPYGRVVLPTEEESPRDKIRQEHGYLNGVVEHQNRYGRVPLHPDKVKDLMIDEAMIATIVPQIRLLASDSISDACQFFEAIDRMLSWVPEAGKTNGMQIDFAKRARETLAVLKAKLPAAIGLLTALQEVLHHRSADKPLTAAHQTH
jgi:hypothetical protein